MDEERDLITEGIAEGSTDEPAGDRPEGSGNQSPRGSEGPPEAATAGADGTKDRPAGWRLQLPEALRDDKRLDRFDGKGALEKVVTAYLNAEERLGRAVEVPGEGATDEELSRFRARLRGVETPEDYDLSELKLRDGVTLTEDGLKAYRQIAFAAGLNPQQTRELIEWDAERKALETAFDEKARRETRTKAKREAEQELRGELAGEYEPTLKAAQNLVRSYGDARAIRELNEEGAGNHPWLVAMLGRIARDIGEGAAPRGDGRGGPAAKRASMFPVAEKIAADNRSRRGA